MFLTVSRLINHVQWLTGNSLFLKKTSIFFHSYVILVTSYGGQSLLFVAWEKRLMGCIVWSEVLIVLKNYLELFRQSLGYHRVG
jgi:hypothetical protein